MPRVTVEAKAKVHDARRNPDIFRTPSTPKIDFTETCFAGKGRLTVERFEKELSVASEMRKKVCW